MVAKAFLICVAVGLALLGPRMYQYYRHKLGYDDSTVIHQVGGGSYSIPQELPTSAR